MQVSGDRREPLISWESFERGAGGKLFCTKVFPRGRSHRKGAGMEQRDLDLIEQWKEKDPELKRLWQEHLEFEEQLLSFNKRVYLSASEQTERKVIQKKKLKGRDQIERILTRIRNQG